MQHGLFCSAHLSAEPTHQLGATHLLRPRISSANASARPGTGSAHASSRPTHQLGPRICSAQHARSARPTHQLGPHISSAHASARPMQHGPCCARLRPARLRPAHLRPARLCPVPLRPARLRPAPPRISSADASAPLGPYTSSAHASARPTHQLRGGAGQSAVESKAQAVHSHGEAGERARQLHTARVRSTRRGLGASALRILMLGARGGCEGVGSRLLVLVSLMSLFAFAGKRWPCSTCATASNVINARPVRGGVAGGARAVSLPCGSPAAAPPASPQPAMGGCGLETALYG
mgnify:CR=1 FL=1